MRPVISNHRAKVETNIRFEKKQIKVHKNCTPPTAAAAAR